MPQILAETGQYQLGLELVRTAASLAVPFVLVWAAHRLQRKQKFFEAVMSEKVKHYGYISPLLNTIFSYRFRVGDFLDRTPESVLDAKRRADHEFWTFEYLWSDEFRRTYFAFMNDSFKVFGAEGTKALIRAEGQFYHIKPCTPKWAGFSEEAADRERVGKLYAELKAAIARDLGFPTSTVRG